MTLLIAVAAIAGGYQLFATIVCALRRGQEPGGMGRGKQGTAVSILKPVAGLDEGLRDAIASHVAMKTASEFELLCGVKTLDDPAVAVIREFPSVRVIVCTTKTANAKVGVLMDLVAEARHPVIVVNDADIRVEPDYLDRVTEPLHDPQVGLVTCLFRTKGSTFASRFEGLGVVTDFAPSALVARAVGVDEFAMGSTMAFRRTELDRIGGFAAIADYVADDYQLGHRIHALGLRCVLSDVVVETGLGGSPSEGRSKQWAEAWTHQVRWARTVRVSKPGGYLGLPVTFATLWAVVALAFGQWEIALVLLGARMLMAIASGWFVLRSTDVLRLWWAIPLRDLYMVAVWSVGLFGNTVMWRGRKLRLDREGRIV
jgi:ceramide glucosyltransferase